MDPHKRLTASDVLNHPWIAQRDNLPHMRLTLQNPAEVKVLSMYQNKILEIFRHLVNFLQINIRLDYISSNMPKILRNAHSLLRIASKISIEMVKSADLQKHML